jgi:hypothetical protein
MTSLHTITTRELLVGDAVSLDAQQLLASWVDVPASYTGSDVTVVGKLDNNYGDSFLIEWSDGSAFDVHPGLSVTVTRSAG